MINITLVKGVTGGFVEASPELHILIDVGKDKVSVQKSIKSDAPAAADGFKTNSIELDASQVKSLVDGWEAILKTLPIEEPKGCEDIYGLDYSLQFHSSDLKWANTPNEGCNSTPSTIVPSKEQKQRFQDIVNQIEIFASTHIK